MNFNGCTNSVSWGNMGLHPKISKILMDVDGTMTQVRSGGRVPPKADFRLAELLADKMHESVEHTSDMIHHLKDWEQHCIFDLANKVNVPECQLWQQLVKDWEAYIDFPDDTVFFLKEMRRRNIPVYSATTNSRRMTLMKMSIGGLADKDGTPFLSGFFSGNHFHDPLGKFAPNFFQRILEETQFNPDEVVMIGDEYIHDCTPAMNAGIHWVFLLDRQSQNEFVQDDSGVIRTNSLHHIASWILNVANI